jgi:hypothetical protein
MQEAAQAAPTKRTTVGLADAIFFDVPPTRPLRCREPPSGCLLTRDDNSSVHWIAYRLHMRTTAATARCSTCGAPTSATDVWRALSALSFLHLVPAGSSPPVSSISVSRCRSATGGDVLVFTVVDADGKASVISDGSEVFLGSSDSTPVSWSHMVLDVQPA